MIHELRHTIRALVRVPGYSAIIVITLALAIGATTTIYSVVHGVLLAPLPFPDQERLVTLWQRAPGVGVTEDWFSPAQYFDIVEGTPSLEHVAVTYGQEVTLTGDETDPVRLGSMRISSSFFDVMGIEPAIGRRFSSADDVQGAADKILLSHQLFTQRFAGDRSIVGQSLEINGRRLEVVGVLAPLVLDGDIVPTLVTVPIFDMLMSFPMVDPQTTRRGSENFNIIGKLAAGASHAQLETELLAVATTFTEDPGGLAAGLEAGNEFFIGVVPLLDQVVGRARVYLFVLLGATGLLLAIACANVANLLLTRAATQRREVSIRAALGARRGRMVLQAMLESSVLATLGGTLGLGVALVAVRALHLAAPDDLPRLRDVAIDPGVLVFTGGICVVSSVLFGLGPALRTSNAMPADVLREAAASVRARSLWRRGGSRFLVIAQVALSLILIIGAGLLVRTFAELQAVDPGFRPDRALSFRLSLVGPDYGPADARRIFFRQLFERLDATPGVVVSGGTSLLPLTRGLAWTDYVVEGFNEDDPDARIVADVMTATPGYFEAMGTEIIAGRSFLPSDRGEPAVAIVNRVFAERFWPVDEAVGKWIGNDFTEHATIVGVIETVKHYGLDAETRPAVFSAYAASPNRGLFGVLRSEDAADGSDASTVALAAAVTRIVGQLDPDLPVYDIRSMADRMRHSLAKQRVLMWLLNFFAATALLLATVGLYGVLSFAVATQTRELGIRKALGAQQRDLYRLVLWGAGIMTALGIVAGGATALWIGRALDSLVYGVGTNDPASFAVATALVVGVALAASLLPARRAASVDPMVALKQE